jgi:hypothetical protein
MTVLTPANALPGAPFPQHLSGQTTTVTSYVYPGAVQPKSTLPVVLSYTNALPGGSFPQHLSGQTSTVQSYLYPGAVQAAVGAPPAGNRGARVTIVGQAMPWRLGALMLVGTIVARNPTCSRRTLLRWARKH